MNSESFDSAAERRAKFQESVERFQLTDDDLAVKYRQYVARARTEAVICIIGLVAAGYVLSVAGRLPAIAVGVFALSRGGYVYLCALRARSIARRELPELPSIFRRR